MLAVRVIPLVLYDGVQAVKTKQFDKASYRNVGHVVNLAKVYNNRQVDELVFLDISEERLSRGPDFDLFTVFAQQLYSPFSVGGGFENLYHVKRAFDVGVDKIVVNTHARVLIPQIAEKYGTQAVIASVDHLDNVDDTVGIAQAYEALGAGEILLQSVARDGMMNGYDLSLVGQVSSAVSIPVIAASGLGSSRHAIEVLSVGAHAVAGASLFHFTEVTPLDVSKAISSAGYPSRFACQP